MSYWNVRRSSAGALIGFIGLIIVATLLSACVGSSSTTSEVGLVSDTTLFAPTVSTSLPTSSSTANQGGGAGPQTPPCGTFEVTKAEVVSGQQFSKGKYQINSFGISCDEVMGNTGLFSKFLQLEDNEALPEPWSFLEGAVGAPKFISGPAVGFRVQRISD